MSRTRAFAESVVIMVCPVLLAIVLEKVKLKSVEHGRAIPILMLVVAAFTLTSGTIPFIALSFSKRFSARARRLPTKITTCSAPVSCVCLVGLACWIVKLILIQRWAYAFPAFGIVFFLSIVIRSVMYYVERGDPSNLVAADELPVNDEIAARRQIADVEEKLDKSLELLAGVTAMLFLGMEGLALEGQTNGGQGRLAAPIGICFFACLFGVCFMLLETIPPPPPGRNDTGCRATIVRNLTEFCDVFMALAIGAVMLTIMIVLVKLLALLLLSPVLMVFLVHVFDIAVGGGGGGGNPPNVRPASLELSKVTFTGFLAVSIPAISRRSLSKSTECFLILAASAIVSGIAWRLLTHTKKGTSANVASFCTHLCIAVATVPFTVMAGEALH
uniref:Uncharacterized protein n=1 Tax=Leersia perrieri TaxID=77586 RepID=A0A0D9V0M2_9ORYZ